MLPRQQVKRAKEPETKLSNCVNPMDINFLLNTVPIDTTQVNVNNKLGEPETSKHSNDTQHNCIDSIKKKEKKKECNRRYKEKLQQDTERLAKLNDPEYIKLKKLKRQIGNRKYMDNLKKDPVRYEKYLMNQQLRKERKMQEKEERSMHLENDTDDFLQSHDKKNHFQAESQDHFNAYMQYLQSREMNQLEMITPVTSMDSSSALTPQP
jgi:hypothetical protein